VYHDYTRFPEVNRRIALPYVALGVSLAVQVCDFQAGEVAVKNSSCFSVFFLLLFIYCGRKLLLVPDTRAFSAFMF
jgi:hypothetical protein